MAARESLDIADWLFEYRWQQYGASNTPYLPLIVRKAIISLIDICMERWCLGA